MAKKPETQFEAVLQEELNSINERRKAVEPTWAPSSGIDKPPEKRIALTGLALSGGGIRAACIGLGLLQSLYRRGILRQIDYLSTVSGSGYIGSYMTSWLASLDEKKVNWRPENEPKSDEVNLPFHCSPNSPQPPDVQMLANRGETLNRPIRFLSRHLGGLLAINAFLLCGLFAFGAILAFLFRMLDSPGAMVFLTQLGFGGDIARALFPAAVMFAVWIFCSVLMRYFQSKRIETPQFAAMAYLALLASVALGIVTVLSLKNADVYVQLTNLGFSPQNSDVIQTIISVVQKSLMVLFSIAVLPYLNLKALIRSGTTPKNRRDTILFNLASKTLVAGMPLLVFWFMCRENISGWNEQREMPYSMGRGHIKDWELFWNRVKASANSAADPSTKAVSGRILTEVNKEPQLEGKLRIDQFLDLHNVRDEQIRQTWIWERWLSFAGHLMRFGDRFEDSWRNETQYVAMKDQIIESFNERVLSNENLFSEYLSSDVEKHPNFKTAYARLLLAQRDVADVRPSGSTLWELHRLRSQQFFDLSIARSRQPLASLSQFDKALGNAERDFLEIRQTLGKVQRANWEMLMLLYREDRDAPVDMGKNGDLIAATDVLHNWKEVFSTVVLPNDQNLRIRVAAISFCCFLLIGVAFSINPTTLHGFYRDQLSELWLVKHATFGLFLPLRKLKNAEKGAPLHLIHGALNLFGRMRNPEKDTSARFTFSATHVGAERTGYALTKDYMKGKYNLADAMAISGAAVTPTAVDNLLVRWLLVLSNFRLGQWLHHPQMPPGEISYPSALRLLWEQLTKAPEDRAYQFVTDGGHDENTGIGALLQRRCRVIISCDSSQDGGYTFADLRRLMSEGVDKFGVTFHPVDLSKDYGVVPPPHDSLSRLRPTRTGANNLEKPPFSDEHFIVYQIHYPNDDISRTAGLDVEATSDTNSGQESYQGWLIYIKSSITKFEPEELRRFPEDNPEFPHDATLDQFFEPSRFMRYRQLGECLGEDVWKKCFSGWSDKIDGTFWLAKHWPKRNAPPTPEVVNVQTSSGKSPAVSHMYISGPLTTERKEQLIEALTNGTPDEIESVCTYLCDLDEAPVNAEIDTVRERLTLCYDRTDDEFLKVSICNAHSSIATHEQALAFIRQKLTERTKPSGLHNHLLGLLRDLKISGSRSNPRKSKPQKNS